MPLDVAVVAVAVAELLQELGARHAAGDQLGAVSDATFVVGHQCAWFSRGAWVVGGPEVLRMPGSAHRRVVRRGRGRRRRRHQVRPRTVHHLGREVCPSACHVGASSSSAHRAAAGERRRHVRVVRDDVFDLGNAAAILARLTVSAG